MSAQSDSPAVTPGPSGSHLPERPATVSGDSGPVSGPAERLRLAANLVEQRAAAATPGPWHPEYSYHHPDRVQGVFVEDGATCPAPIDCCDGCHGIGGFDSDGDNRWVLTVHPGLGPLLAAWLRDKAGRLDAHIAALVGYRPDPVVDYGDHQRPEWRADEIAENVACHWGHELAVADFILAREDR